MTQLDFHSTTMPQLDVQAVAKVVLEMKKLANRDVCLDEWADFVSLKKHELIAGFNRLTGIPPMTFHNAEKLEIAKRLLVLQEMPVTDVCFEIGFESLGSFISKFTGCVGVSPGNYARSMRRFGFPAHFINSVLRSKRQPQPPGPKTRVSFDSPSRQFSQSLVAAVFRRPFPSGYPAEWRFIPPFCHATTISGGSGGYCLAASMPSWPRLEELVNLRPTLVGRAALGNTGEDVRLELRTPTIFDPPITLAVPALFSFHPELR